jgi:hypothetical protein
MQPPTLVSTTDTTIQIKWTPLVDPATGNSAVLSYLLLWDNGTGVTDVQLQSSLLTSYTASGLTGGSNYKFKVAAVNIYGQGLFSTELIQEACD